MKTLVILAVLCTVAFAARIQKRQYEYESDAKNLDKRDYYVEEESYPAFDQEVKGLKKRQYEAGRIDYDDSGAKDLKKRDDDNDDDDDDDTDDDDDEIPDNYYRYDVVRK